MIIGVLSTGILAQTDTWRKQHDRGNRYEGRIEIPVGKPDLELLSFVGFREPFTTDVTLKVRFFLPTDSPVFIQGRELQEQKQYWMESKPWQWPAGVWNEFGPWPTREVLSREGVPAWNLGVVIRLYSETSNSGALVPAFVYHSTLPASVNKYILYLRPSSTLKKVTSSFYRIVDNQEVEVKGSSLLGDIIAGEPFPIELDVRELAEGSMRLVVQGAYKNRLGGLIREYRFYHKLHIN